MNMTNTIFIALTFGDTMIPIVIATMMEATMIIIK